MAHSGSCLCGAVTFQVSGELQAPNGCHCGPCRKTSGHYFVSTDVARDAVSVQGAANVTWFQSSEKVRRGFCKTCGSNLFWDPVFQDWTAIAMGAFDDPTGVKINLHIYVADKGDYYDISDAVEQHLRPPK